MSIKISHYAFPIPRPVICGSFRAKKTALERRGRVLALLLIVPLLLSFPTMAGENFRRQIVQTPDQLPAGVRRTVLALAQAARSGKIDNMRDVLQMNELMPLIDGQFIHDPVTHWKKASKDRTGRTILAIFSQLLSSPPRRKQGPDGIQYVWPWFADIPRNSLTREELSRIHPSPNSASPAPSQKSPNPSPAYISQKNTDGSWRYSYYRLAIGADGTWHSFDLMAHLQR